MSRVPWGLRPRWAIGAALLALAAWNPAAPALAEGLRLQTLRAQQHSHHAERGEVPLERLARPSGPQAAHAAFALDPHLSIFVTDVDTVQQVLFSEVMDQLARQSGDPLLTKTLLFQQWFDTEGQGPGLGLGPHCDDDTPPQPGSGIADHSAVSTLNRFPYRCPRIEVSEAASDPFTGESPTNPASYSAIAFSNRFDLIGAPQPASPGSHRMISPDCGEYRIVFARNTGKSSPLNRNLIIFEARVPNPDPERGEQGCRPILDFWLGLSRPSMTAVERGKKLHDFYLKGLPSHNPHHHVGPIVDIAHYSFNAGQIRTNQFLGNEDPANPTKRLPGSPVDWTLREYKTLAVNGTLVIVPDSVKTNPGNDLLLAGSTDPRIGALMQDLRAQLGNLLGGAGFAKGTGDINSIGFSVSGEGINAFESDEHDPGLGDVTAAFDGTAPPPAVAPPPTPNPLFNAQLLPLLAIKAPALTPTDVINRMETQTCAGCHHYSNGKNLGGGGVWPDKKTGSPPTIPSMDFTQESEQDGDLQAAASGSGKRYATSLTLEQFLVFREAFMKKALGL
jgi:hypothetical protein